MVVPWTMVVSAPRGEQNIPWPVVPRQQKVCYIICACGNQKHFHHGNFQSSNELLHQTSLETKIVNMFKLSLRSVRAPVAKLAFAPRIVAPSRFYAVAPISREEVTQRAFEALKTVTAIQESKLTLESSFQKDLGLDSLDTVEALVALEEEFDLEIPDKISDEIKTVKEAVDYIYQEEQKL